MTNYDFEKAWIQVQEFESKGLPESALKIVNEIYKNSKIQKNASNQVKSVIFQLKFLNEKEENSTVKNIYKVQNEIKTAEFPVKPVLHSMLAEMYWRYYQANRWKFKQRTKTVNFKNDDLETWTSEKIVDETIHNYQQSLDNKAELKKYKINLLTEIISGGNEIGKDYRETLFDFLGHRAVDFYMGEEPGLTQPAYNFTINSAEYLLSATEFSKINIISKDTLAYKYYALKIFQQLIEFHLNDEKPDALIDVDLKRLQFVYQHLTLSNKTELYLKTLENLEQKYISSPLSTKITYQIASIWQLKGNLYNASKSEDHKLDLKKAFEIAEVAKKRFPKSDGANMCIMLQDQILLKSISVQTEAVNIPNQAFRALIKFKNFTNANWRIIKTDKNEITSQRKKWESNYNVNREEKFLEYFAAKKPVKFGSIILPDEKDFQFHSAEVKIEGVPEGDYMILFSNDENFKTSSNVMAYGFTTISNINFISRNQSDGSNELYVLNRESGQALKAVKVRLLYNKYNSKRSEYVITKGDSFTTDEKGYVKIPLQKRDDIRNFYFDFTYQNDKLSTIDIDSYRYSYNGIFYQNTFDKRQYDNETFFFLDRAIYRPGQTIYFKGLMISTDGKNPKILTKQTSNVVLYDVNHQVVVELKLTTNEYGTFNGSFTAPSSGLTGFMTLDNGSGSTSFSVEEYKRPKFEVNIDTLKGSFRLNEIIKIEGKAQAYSGANIDGALVKYRIVRSARYPYWWWCRWGYYPTSPEVEILNGQSNTDEKGKFKFDFQALPDLNISKDSDPTFSYKVYVDVTDINGETHSNQKTVDIGYKALLVSADISDFDKSEKESINVKINSINLAGQFEPAKGKIIIWKLKNPLRTYRERSWEKPDQFIYSEDEFHKFFPHDQFADENNFLKWEKEKEVVQINFDTEKGKNLNFKNIKNWVTGKYLLEISSQDKYNEPVKEVKYFDVFDTNAKHLAYPETNKILPLTTSLEPGGKMQILFSTSLPNTNVLYEIEQDGNIIFKEWLNVNNSQHILEFLIKEEDRGGLAAHFAFMKDNRIYIETLNINVPYSNKNLDISFESFRDKLQPGQEEHWKLKIAGPKGEKVMSEMLASMYDASLDSFRPHTWDFNIFSGSVNRLGWIGHKGYEIENFKIFDQNWNVNKYLPFNTPYYDNLNWFGYDFYQYNYPSGGLRRSAAPMMSKSRDGDKQKKEISSELAMDDSKLSEVVVVGYGTRKNQPPTPPTSKENFSEVKIRKNFNETAFFFPDLKTDENGNIIINFTIPEALTRWKMMGFAHTQDLKSGMITKELVTQKDLMVVPNQPRFFRENDKMVFAVKVNSLTDKELNGQARLEFFDALTMKSVDQLLKNYNKQQNFSLKAGQSTNLEWNIEIPEGLQAITYRVVAKAGNYSDGEEMTLPVVTNRMLVTETLPLPIRANQTKEFKFEKLINNKSTTLKNHRFTLEFTSNPAWYAVQALPYLMEYPYECVEQTFARFYANSIASHIANSNPKIKNVFDTWKNIQPDALLSNLEKNQELKTALLEETPWVLQAKNESQRKRNIALLFDLNRMANEQERAIEKILKAQTYSGGFTWFPGYQEDRYMTQHIVTGLGHLDVMGVKAVRNDEKVWSMTKKAIAYLDIQIADDYEKLKAQAKKGLINIDDNHLGYLHIQYLYSRSYFKDVPINKSHQGAINYFLGQEKKYWLQNSIYMQGMIALGLQRFDEKIIPQNIIKSLNEKALHSDEMGMYWKYESGYYWYQAPIETQSLMIEVYDEVAKDKNAVEDLKTWLLKQKQTQDWRTTKATSEACYALLRRGTDLLANDKLVEITVGDIKVDPKKSEENKVEAGTGYFKSTWAADQVNSKMGNIKVTNPNNVVAWGAAYWQYFEQLDKITSAETPLKIKKQLFLQQNTDRGPVITPVTDKTELKNGDLIKVRIELRVDRMMEYVHLKDMRAAGLEPIETLSTYKYQDGLGYYESTRDLATNFFIAYLNTGTHVFEYSLRVSQKGDFSNGVTTIQCMYAPEFSSHSEGVRVKIK